MNYREKIMEECINLFMQKDCKEIKIDAIAENLGISKRTIYENFSSKTEIIEKTLLYYQGVLRDQLKEASEKETNPLRKILILCQTIIKNVQHVKIAQIYNLKRDYPEIAQKLIKESIHFQLDFVSKCYIQAQKEGYIFPDIDPDFMILLLFNGERHEGRQKITFMNKEYDSIKLFTVHLFTIIRGVSTLKGIQVFDAYLKENIIEKI